MITGGAQGIGRAIALQYARHGYFVSIADTHREAGHEVVRFIRNENGKAMFVNYDISNQEQVERWAKLTVQQWGRIDVLINNAGISCNRPIFELELSDFMRVIDVNLKGAFLCSKVVATHMRTQRTGGSIINIASTRALMSEANTEAYSASKGGIVALTHAMAVSLGPYNIRVNAISPGWIEVGDWQYSQDAQVPHHSEQDKLQHPVGRVGKPEDIAQACLFLSEENSGFITGQNLIVDGGMTIKMIYV